MIDVVTKRQEITGMRRAFGQLVRFGVAGAVVNLALYLFYLAITFAGLSPIAGATTAFLMGIPFSLFAHGRFTFRTQGLSLERKALFAGGYLLGYATQIGALSGLHYGLGLPHQLAQFVAMILVAFVLFIFQKVVVFRA